MADTQTEPKVKKPKVAKPAEGDAPKVKKARVASDYVARLTTCLLYTSDAADE